MSNLHDSIKTNHITSEISPDLIQTVKIIETENGILGKFFGSSNQAPSNIAGFTLTVLLGLLIYLFVMEQNENIDLLFSSFTMILGFLFGGNKEITS